MARAVAAIGAADARPPASVTRRVFKYGAEQLGEIVGRQLYPAEPGLAAVQVDQRLVLRQRQDRGLDAVELLLGAGA
ncbi:MAG: hypothetical protein L0H29_05275, partial [Sinobacteraceae bacterium]|nr:hypothetical protein [Nevskiaceae bacterium]